MTPSTYLHYNFIRPHKGISKPYVQTSAMAEGLTDRLHSMDLIVAREPKPKRDPYKTRPLFADAA